MDDWDLFLSGIEGDENAFKEVVRKCDRLLRFWIEKVTGRVLRGWSDLEDTVQATWCKAIKFGQDGRFNKSRKFTSWIVGVCWNTIDGGPGPFAAPGQGGGGGCLAPTSDPVDTHKGPSDLVGEIEMLQGLDACIERLPQDLRRVYELVYVDGLKAAAAARVLGCCDTNVRTRLLPLLWRVMKKCLAGKGFGDIDVS